MELVRFKKGGGGGGWRQGSWGLNLHSGQFVKFLVVDSAIARKCTNLNIKSPNFVGVFLWKKDVG